MGLADDLRASPRRYPMRLDEIRGELSDDDLKVVDEALADPAVSDSIIAGALTKNGHSIAACSVRSWRRRHGSD